MTTAAPESVTETAAAETPAGAHEHPGNPSLAEEIEHETARLNKGFEIARERGFISRREVNAPKGAVNLKAQRAAGTAPVAAEAEPVAPPAPAAPNGKSPAATKPPGEPPVEQQSLSAGFGKLARRQRHVERAEAESTARLVAAKQAEEIANKRLLELEAREKTWEPKVQSADQVERLLSGDEYDLLQAVATKKGETATALFNRLTKRMANAGKIAPEDAVAAVNDEVAKLKAELAKRDAAAAADREKADADAKAKLAAAEKQRIIDEGTVREKAHFVNQVKADAVKYPRLAAEDPKELGDVAHALALDFIQRNGGRAPADINERVAMHLEKVLAYEEYQSNQTNGAGKAPVSPEPAKPAAVAPKVNAGPSARGNGAAPKTAKPEASAAIASRTERPKNGLQALDDDDDDRPGPRTLTNQLGSERSGSRRREPRTDKERLEAAIDAWGTR